MKKVLTTYYNISETGKHYIKWKKPKGHIWYGFIHIKYPEQVNPQRQ